MLKRSIPIFFVALLVVCVFSALAQADAPAPGYEAYGYFAPTHLPPGGTGELNLYLYDVGAVAPNGQVRVVDRLPDGVTATSAPGCTGVGTSEVVCEIPASALAPGSYPDRLAISVSVPSDAPLGEASDGVVVSGGGALGVTNATVPMTVSSTPAGFGISTADAFVSNADGTNDTQAGSHPYELTVAFAVNSVMGENGPEAAGGEVRDIDVKLPPGLVGNPNAIPQCSREDFDNGEIGLGEGKGCPSSTQIGTVYLQASGVNGTWQNENKCAQPFSVRTHDNSGDPAGFTGCERLTHFEPSISIAPDTTRADTPAGLTATLKVPQEVNPDGLATSGLKDTTVTLPEGMAINPGQATGLAACQPSQENIGGPEAERESEDGPPNCPSASKVGEDEISTPLLPNRLKGNVYVLQSNPPELKLLVAASADGVNLKLIGTVHLNEKTGQLVTTFENTPDAPLNEFKLSFSGGAQAQANEGTCPEASKIGHAVVGAGPGPDPFYIPQNGAPPARVYLTGPYQGAPFGLSIVTPVVAGPFNLGTNVVRAKIEINPLTTQITVTTDPSGPHSIPTILDGIPTDIRSINTVIERPGFMFNPTNCKETAFTYGASLTAKIVYPTTPPGNNQASSQSNIASVKVDLPKQLPSRLTTLQKACLAATFEADPASCPAASVVGHAKVITPILPVPLEGPAYFVSHGGEAFPSLIVVLQGYGVTVELIGTTFISKAGITSSTFKSTPDVPFSSFELNLPEGPYSALTANLPPKDNYNLCGQKLAMPTAFIGQNGAEIHQSTPLSITGCAKGKTAKKAKKSKKKAKSGRRK